MTPILLEKRENDRWLALRAAKSVQRLAHQTFGRSHLVIKVSILSVLLMMGALLVLHGDRTVVAEAVVQGSEIRTIAAPFAGFIAEAPFREGDTVSRGDLLVRLDDRDFMLELTRLTAVRGQTELELDKAMSEHNRSEAALAESRIRQNDAEIALTQQQIARSKIIATFDGTVISGDLSNNIGGSVDQGQPLLVVAPLTDFRVDLMVPEDAVDKIKADQSAALKVAPLPERSFALTLRQTMPVARYENGQTRYQVEGRFVTRPEGLVPGMTGIARISLGRASLAELWLGPIVDRLRLWFWRNVAI
jgi:multidrug resistance efflux pump